MGYQSSGVIKCRNHHCRRTAVMLFNPLLNIAGINVSFDLWVLSMKINKIPWKQTKINGKSNVRNTLKRLKGVRIKLEISEKWLRDKNESTQDKEEEKRLEIKNDWLNSVKWITNTIGNQIGDGWIRLKICW